MPFFKVENNVDDDSVYYDAPNMDRAKAWFKRDFGDVPESMLQWSAIDKPPKGEVAIKVK